MIIKLRNAHREQLRDEVRIFVYRNRDLELAIDERTDLTAEIEVEGLEPFERYRVRVFPKRYRPTACFARGDQRITLHCPALPSAVHRIEVAGEIDDLPVRKPLNELELDNKQIAGALNIWAKLKETRIGDQPAAEYVKRITRFNPDRIWFEPDPELYSNVLSMAGKGVFSEVSGTLHDLHGYHTGRSFKTLDLYCSLQLTFLHKYSLDPLERRLSVPETLVDADIDEAGGLVHAFQVIRHTLTGGKTDPYDVHEILAFHQEIDTGYRLIV